MARLSHGRPALCTAPWSGAFFGEARAGVAHRTGAVDPAPGAGSGESARPGQGVAPALVPHCCCGLPRPAGSLALHGATLSRASPAVHRTMFRGVERIGGTLFPAAAARSPRAGPGSPTSTIAPTSLPLRPTGPSGSGGTPARRTATCADARSHGHVRGRTMHGHVRGRTSHGHVRGRRIDASTRAGARGCRESVQDGLALGSAERV